MLTVTDEALERLSRQLARKSPAGDVAIRFRRSQGRWRLRVDRVRPDDTTITHNGRKLLLLDEAAAKAMAAMTLLVRETRTGPRLKLSRIANPEG